MIGCEELCECMSAARNSTLKRLRRVPTGQANWRMAPDKLSFAEITQHLIDADRVVMEGIRTGHRDDCLPHPGMVHLETHLEFEAMVQTLEGTLAAKTELLRSLGDDGLNRVVNVDLYGEIEPMPIWRMIFYLNLDHEAHHRGQLVAYLNLVERRGA